MNRNDRPLTRRQMLARTAQTTAFVSWAAACEPLLAAPRSRWFKIGACEWCLGKRDPSCFEVAKEIGLDGVQVDLGTVANEMHLKKHDVQKAYLDAAKKSGLEVASLAISEMNRVPLTVDPQAEHFLADSIDVCKALGVKVVLAAFFGRGELDMKDAKAIDHVVEAIQRVAKRAEELGVVIGLENYLSAEDNMDIIQRIGSPAVKVYYDVGNSTDKGRNVCREIRMLGPLICEFHAKDSRFMLGQGRIDFAKVRHAIDDIGYSGWIQIEAAHPHGLVEDYTADYKYLRTVFPERKR
jgi:sugar phosphate isomerase/epimerase